MRLSIDRLPKTVRLLAEVIGLQATLQLVNAFGGQTIWPAKGGAGYAALAEVIGEESAAKLVAHFRETIHISKCSAAVLAVVHDQVRSEFDRLTQSGHSARAAVSLLVRSSGYTDRHIWRLLSQSDTGEQVVDTIQAELF